MVVGILALIATLAAVAGTGLVVMRAGKERRLDLAVWALTLAALTMALAAMAAGSLAGFNGVIFRAMELGGAIVAPIWLAVGIVQLITHFVQVRFATWLISISYSIVAAVILTLDPLIGTFTSTLPKPDEHYQVLPLTLIDGAHVIAVLSLVACAGVTAWRASKLDRTANEMLIQVALGALAGVLVVTGTRGFLPGVAAVIALGAATGLVWFGAQKTGAAQPALAGFEGGQDEYAEDGYHQGRHETYPAARGGRGRSAGGYEEELSYPEQPHEDLFPDLDPAGAEPYGSEEFAQEGFEQGTAPGWTPGTAPPGPSLSGSAPSVPVGPATAAAAVPSAPPPGLRFSLDEPLGAPTSGQGTGSPSAPPVGQVVIFTLLEGRQRLFDQLVGETVRAAREAEPDLLVFTCHEVTNAPTQRIFYRLFRDQAGFDDHERMPHIQRFLAESRSHVLATNVVDLRLSAAKVVPLPSFLTRDLP